MKDSRSDTAEKTRNTSLGWHSLYRKEDVGSIISCTPISSRLISIRISISETTKHTPTSDHEDEQVEQFYEQLDSIIAKTQKKDIVIVHGDRNAKVGLIRTSTWQGQ